MFEVNKLKIIHAPKSFLPEVGNIILDINSYSEFVPWCESVIIKKDFRPSENRFIADLNLSFMSFKHSYESETTFDIFEDNIMIRTIGKRDKVINSLLSSWSIRYGIDSGQECIFIEYSVKVDLIVSAFLPIQSILSSIADKISDNFEKKIKNKLLLFRK